MTNSTALKLFVNPLLLLKYGTSVWAYAQAIYMKNAKLFEVFNYIHPYAFFSTRFWIVMYLPDLCENNFWMLNMAGDVMVSTFNTCNSAFHVIYCTNVGSLLSIKTVFSCMRIPMLKIRRLRDRLPGVRDKCRVSEMRQLFSDVTIGLWRHG